MKGSNINILLVDDHPLMREGIIKVLSTSPAPTTVTEAVSAEQMFGYLREDTYDLIVLDISLPGRSGVDSLKDLKNLYPQIPVLILTMHPEEQFAVRVLKLGASGYVNKKSASKELLTAIDAIFQGKKYFNSNIIDQIIVPSKQPSVQKTQLNLSDREFEVLCGIAKGKSVTDISMELNISISTVSTYRFRILEKTGLRSNADIVRFAVENNLIE